MTEDQAVNAGPWCPPGGCPVRRTAELEHAIALAFEHGRAYERAELAQLETTWQPIARATWEEQVARRMAELPGKNPPPPLRFDDPDWPPVALPGAPGLRIGPDDLIAAGVDGEQIHGDPSTDDPRQAAYDAAGVNLE